MPWTIEQPAGLNLPANVAKPSSFAAAAPLSLPCLMFFHGTGQTSLPDGITRDAPTPITQANSDLLKQDVGGEDWPFIVWAAYDAGNNWGHSETRGTYDDIVNNAAAYKIDVNNIHCTGLSLGGIGIAVIMTLSPQHSFFRFYKGLFPVSGSNVVFDATFAQNCVDRAVQTLRGWYGELDPNTWVVGGPAGMDANRNIINGIQPNYYELIEIAGAGHSPAAWGVPYSDNSQNADTIYYQILLNASLAPIYQSSEVTNTNKNQIALTYDVTLDGASIPATTDFVVSGGKTVTLVSITGAVVTLTVNTDYAYNETITVSYTAGANPIQDGAGNPADNLVNEAVINNILDTTAPSIPTGLVSSNITSVSFTVSWDASTDTESGVSHYIVLLDSVSQGTTPTLSWDFSGLLQNTQYSVTLQAVDNIGNISAESTALLVTTLADLAQQGSKIKMNALI